MRIIIRPTICSGLMEPSRAGRIRRNISSIIHRITLAAIRHLGVIVVRVIGEIRTITVAHLVLLVFSTTIKKCSTLVVTTGGIHRNR